MNQLGRLKFTDIDPETFPLCANEKLQELEIYKNTFKNAVTELNRETIRI